MKKLLKIFGIAALIAAVMGFGFVGCADDDGGGSSAPTLDEISKKVEGMTTTEDSEGNVTAITLKGKTYTDQAAFKKDFAAEWAVIQAKAKEIGEDDAKQAEFAEKYPALAELYGALMDLPETAPSAGEDPTPAPGGEDPTPGVTATSATWTLTGKTISADSGKIYKQKRETVNGNETGTYFNEEVTSIGSGAHILTAEKTIVADSGENPLVLSTFAGHGVGASKGSTDAWANADDKSDASKKFTVTADNVTTAYAPAFAVLGYDSSKGLCVKRDVIKIPGVKGNVKITVNFYQNSTSDRNLEITVGDDGTTDTAAAGTTKGDCTPKVVSADCGEAGKNIYIGASNDLYIKSIKIEAAN